jgi:hypothetical protein
LGNEESLFAFFFFEPVSSSRKTHLEQNHFSADGTSFSFGLTQYV